MKRVGLIFGLFLALSFIVQACGASPTAAPATEYNKQDRLSTAVAGTLTAATETARPAATSTATPEPTLQPGPLRVVYSRAGSIWVWTEGGERKQLTNNIVDAKPRLSDDGQWIVFERNNELYQVRPDGSDLKVLVSDAFLKPYLPSGYKFIWAEYYDWMPDSHYVYFTTKTGISGPYTDILQYDLFRADADSGEVKQLISAGSGGVPYFSGDGKTIAMMQAKAIFLTNTEGLSPNKVLTFDPVYTGSDLLLIPVAVPMPDSTSFRVLIPTHGPPEGPAKPPELWEILNSGKSSFYFSFASQESLGYRNLSLDGESIVYTRFNNQDKSQICLHTNKSLPDSCWYQDGINGYFISWSPDSTHFVTFDSGEKNEENFYLTNGQGNSVPLNASWLMLWIDRIRYIYVDRDFNLFLGSINGELMKIDKGIAQRIGKGDIWSWEFDFSH